MIKLPTSPLDAHFRRRVEQELNRPSDQFVGPYWFNNANYGTGIVGAYTPRAFGAAGDGVTDDSGPIQACLDAAGLAGGSGAGYKPPVVDFEGLTYATGVQLEIPGSQGITLQNGRIVATAGFTDPTKFLLATGRSSDATLPSGFKIENFTFRQLHLDARHQVNCMLIKLHFRGVVDHCTFVSYKNVGLQTLSAGNSGHEIFIINSQFAEYLWGDTTGVGYTNADLFTGTGLEMNTPDNHVTNCVLSLSKIGIKVNAAANSFSQIHIWTGYVKDPATVAGPTAAFLYLSTGLWITQNASICSFDQMYMDGCEVLWENPWKTSFTNSLFLNGYGDANRAFIRFKPMIVGEFASGVVITGNSFQVQNGGLMKMISVDTSAGTFSPGQVTYCRITDNNFTGVAPKFTTIKAAASANATHTWTFDFTGLFAFGDVIQMPVMTYYCFSGQTTIVRVTNLSGAVVTVSSFDPLVPANLKAINATIYLEANQNQRDVAVPVTTLP